MWVRNGIIVVFFLCFKKYLENYGFKSLLEEVFNFYVIFVGIGIS